MAEDYTVVVVLESFPEKASELKQELLSVASQSRKESTCLGYHLHQDINNPNQFVLYEKWESPEAHSQQFEKPYIKAFAQKIDSLLAKPYQVVCAQELN